MGLIYVIEQQYMTVIKTLGQDLRNQCSGHGRMYVACQGLGDTKIFILAEYVKKINMLYKKKHSRNFIDLRRIGETYLGHERFLGVLTLEDGTDRLPRNVGKGLKISQKSAILILRSLHLLQLQNCYTLQLQHKLIRCQYWARA